MSGKLCLDELEKVRKIARTDQIKIPTFLKDLKAYKSKLRQIGIVNGILKVGIPNHLTEDHRHLKSNNFSPRNNVSRSQNTDKNYTMASYEIERYINNEIVAKTKNTVDIQLPKIDPNNYQSSLCNIL